MNGDLFAPPPAPRRIGYVYVSEHTDVVVVFDERSIVMTEYTGRWSSLRDAILRNKPEGVRIR